MKTDKNYTRHLYQLEPNKYKYSLYSLQLVLNGNHTLTETLKIEPDRKYNNCKGFDNWLILKDQKKWSKCKCKTGLRPVKKRNCFYGDLLNTQSNGRIYRSLILVQFSKDQKTMVVDYFKGLDLVNDAFRLHLFNNHNYYL